VTSRSSLIVCLIACFIVLRVVGVKLLAATSTHSEAKVGVLKRWFYGGRPQG